MLTISVGGSRTPGRSRSLGLTADMRNFHPPFRFGLGIGSRWSLLVTASAHMMRHRLSGTALAPLLRIVGGGCRWSCRRCQRLIVAVKEIQSCFVDLGAHADLVADFKSLIAGRTIGRPLDQTFAAGIAGLGEVDPVGGDSLGQFVVGVLPGKGPNEVSKDIGNFGGMEGA